MKTKKIIVIFTFFLLYSCGFEPLYSKKTINNNYDFTINSIIFSGNSKVNIALKNKFASYLNKGQKNSKLDLNINSKSHRTISSKNKKGNAEGFSLKIIVSLEVFESGNLKNKKIFEENFEYKNKSSKYELDRYEKNILINLSNRVAENIILHLHNTK